MKYRGEKVTAVRRSCRRGGKMVTNKDVDLVLALSAYGEICEMNNAGTGWSKPV
jgi:hypothetical protein